jgi:hypothetical protein
MSHFAPRLVDLENYLRIHFPASDLGAYSSVDGEVHVRYELGEPYENGTDQRILQVNYRACSIIEACFRPEDDILILINDWGDEDPMFGNPTPNHLYGLLGQVGMSRCDERTVEQLQDGEIDEPPVYFKQLLVPSAFGETKYKEIIAGIANHEQGRLPSIKQQVFFISTVKDLVFYMYDDRGCIIYSDAPTKLRHLYEKFNDWLVDYWREMIDSIFEEST